MSPLVQCIYFQLPIPADETRCVGRSVRVSFLLSFSNPSVTIRIVIESSFPPPQIDAIRRHPLLLSTCASINFEGKLVNRFPLFSLTLLLLRVICTPVTREFRSWIKRHCSTSNTNERTNESNRIESRPPRAQSFNSIVLNIIFHAGVIQHDKSIEYITMLDIPARSIPIRLFHTRHVNW